MSHRIMGGGAAIVTSPTPARKLTPEQLADLIFESRIRRAPARIAELVEQHEGHVQELARHLIPDPSLLPEWARFAAMGAARAVEVLESHAIHADEVLTCNALRSLWAYTAMGLRGSQNANAREALALRAAQGNLTDAEGGE